MNEKKDTVITAELTRIVFKNESGFLIGAFRADKTNPAMGLDTKEFTATGTLMNPQASMEYKIFGEWKESPKYGRQFTFTRFETQMPMDSDGIFKYLVRSCKFVGSAIGQVLVDKYGPETLTIMKTDPNRIATEIPGLSITRASKIQKTLVDNENNEKVMVELESLLAVPGMLKNIPGRLYTQYRANAAEHVKENPYILTQFPMVGFALADRVALHVGFPRASVERKAAATIHCMRENQQNGSTWILLPDLMMKIKELIQVVKLEVGVQSLIDRRVLILQDGYVAFRRTARDERMIATKAVMMLSGDCLRNQNEEVAA